VCYNNCMTYALTFITCIATNFFPYLTDCTHRVIPKEDHASCQESAENFNPQPKKQDVARGSKRYFDDNGNAIAPAKSLTKFYFSPDPENPIEVGDTVVRELARCEKVYAPVGADPMLGTDGRRLSSWQTHPYPHPSNKVSY